MWGGEVGVHPDSGEYTHTFKLGLRESVCNQILQARPSQSLNLTFLQPLATFGTASTNAMTGGSKKGK